MANCFVYGDNDGLWAILQKEWYSYKNHGYTWYCECIVDKQKNIYLFDIKNNNIDLYHVKDSILSLIHFFPGFAEFKVKVMQETKIDTGETKKIPIVISMQEFIRSLSKQNKLQYDQDKQQHIQLYQVGESDYVKAPSQQNIKLVI